MGSLSPEALSAWGRVELLGPASGGSVNDLRFARVNGDECVVRVTKRASAAALEWELDLLADVLAKGLGAPEVVQTEDGAAQFDGIVVFRRVPGSQPSTTADWQAVAQYLKQLHQLGVGRPQRPGFLAAAELLEADCGSGIDLRDLPAEAVARCRSAWRRIRDLPRTVVHGDPNRTNIFIDRGEVTLIDWDEARVDTPWFDWADLPDQACPLTGSDRWVARQAAGAWEAALTWTSDREYAEWRLSQVAEVGEVGPKTED